MADDTRPTPREDLSHEALTVNPQQKAFTGKQWQKQDTPVLAQPLENANMMAGGTQNTAGGKEPEVTLSNAVSMIKLDDFSSIHKLPCNRQSFMTGIGAGFTLGALRSILGGSVWSSCSFAVGSFVVGAIGQHQYCMSRRAAEKAGMTRVIDVMNRKELERKAREARKDHVKAERRKAKDEEQDAQIAALKEKANVKSWKFW